MPALCTYAIWATAWQNQQNECTQQRLRSAWAWPSLIRVFVVHVKKPWVLSYPLSAQRRLWSDWADAQADLNLRWAHTHFVGFVISQLNSLHWTRFKRLLIQQLKWSPCILFSPFGKCTILQKPKQNGFKKYKIQYIYTMSKRCNTLYKILASSVCYSMHRINTCTSHDKYLQQ